MNNLGDHHTIEFQAFTGAFQGFKKANRSLKRKVFDFKSLLFKRQTDKVLIFSLKTKYKYLFNF